MDLRQLRYFVTIVQCGSISRAALQLNVAQPALSLHIRNMEAEFGLPLLHRTQRGVQPTEAGLILLRHARLILANVEQAEQEIRGSAAEPMGEVRLGLPSSISHILGVPLVLAAREHYPKVKLRIADAMSGYVLDWLKIGRVDLGLLYQPAEQRELHSIALLTEALVLSGPIEPPPARPNPPGDTIDFAALATLPLILPSPGNGLRDLVDDTATAQAVQLVTSIDIDAFGAIKDLVGRGLGYSVLPAHAVRREVEEGRLRAWAIAPPLTRTVHLVRPIDRPLATAAEAIADLCRVTLRELVHSGAWPMARMLVAT